MRKQVCFSLLALAACMGQDCGTDAGSGLFGPPVPSATDTTYQPGPGESKDIWTTSVYSYAPDNGRPGGGQNDDRLVVGGWSDEYCILLQFNLERLPTEVKSAKLALYCFGRRSTKSTEVWLERITEPWDWRLQGTGRDLDRLWWQDRPMTVKWRDGPLTAPKSDAWYEIDITDLYNAWRRGDYANFGLLLRPVDTMNAWNEFYSSDYSADPGKRPKLVAKGGLPAPKLKFPLGGTYPGNGISGYHFGDWWLGETCITATGREVRRFHTGTDFRAASGDSVYATTDGYVRYAQRDTKWGGYVVIEHEDNTGKWTSAYIHVIPMPDLVGATNIWVFAGKRIATISPGNTNFNPHLHFQKRHGTYAGVLDRRGSLPGKDCGELDKPAFPERFIDPETLNWE